MRSARLALALLLATGSLAACSDDDDGGTTTSSTTASAGTSALPADVMPLDQIELRTELVVELEEPIALVQRPGTEDLYVAEKGGRVVRLTDGEPETVVDISDEVQNSGEQGLLGLEFSADGSRMYLHFTDNSDESGRVIELTVDAFGSERARREVLRVEDPFPNHNGGHLVRGPDGYLYIGLGDGGSGGDPLGNGQDTDALLGKILRIDPAADEPYGIPPDNPFVDGGGAPEVWLYGVRNPWRFSFDRATGDLWVADVGQNEIEEIDLLPASDGRDAGRGANLGWNVMEGREPFAGDENPDGAILPVHQYAHADGGCSVTGGFVYRGASIPALTGAYLFADYCATDLRGIRVAGGEAVDERSWDLDLTTTQSFAEDAAGEVYVLLATGEVLRLAAG